MIPEAAIAVRDGIEEVRKLAVQEMERRGKKATGRTMSTLSTVVSTSPGFVSGELTGESQWKFVGNGRGPGRMPPVDRIREWIGAKGLAVSPWAVAMGIAKRGSKDWRNRAPNVFLSAIDDWEAGGGPDRVGAAAAGHFEQQAVTAAINAFERT